MRLHGGINYIGDIFGYHNGNNSVYDQILPLYYTLKTSISDKPILDFTTSRKAQLGSNSATGNTAKKITFRKDDGLPNSMVRATR